MTNGIAPFYIEHIEGNRVFMSINNYPLQYRSLALMIMGWSICGVAQNASSFLFAYYSPTFQLETQHNGYLMAMMALFASASIIISGPLAGRFGQIPVMMAGFLIAALAALGIGFCNSVIVLYLLTAVLGFGVSTICAPGLRLLGKHSNPRKRGLFFGVSMASYSLVGSAGGAVLLTKIGATPFGWRGAYILVGVLLILAVLAFCIFGRNLSFKEALKKNIEGESIGVLMKYPNIMLCVGMTSFAAIWYFTMSNYGILYLATVKSMTIVQAGIVFAGFGIGSFLGEAFVPILSDYIGRRRTVMLAGFAGSLSFMAFLFIEMGNTLLSGSLFVSAVFIAGCLAIVNSVIPSESVPDHLMSLIISIIPALGQLIGSFFAPLAIGYVAGSMGVASAIVFLAPMPLFIFIGSFYLKETSIFALNLSRNK